MNALLHLLLVLSALQADGGIREKFQALHAKADSKGCAALWQADPSLALPTIEKDLDEANALRTSGKEADAKAAAALESRAILAPQSARDALDAPMIADLAAARAGWGERERGFFADAKRVQARALEWLDKSESRFGLEAAQEAANRSLGLGDWHGAAKAYETCAIAHQGTSNFDDSLVAWETARWIDRGLALRDRELACLRGALDVCGAADRDVRGREVADQAVALARRIGDRRSEADFLDRRARFEKKLGLAAEEAATRKEIAALGK